MALNDAEQEVQNAKTGDQIRRRRVPVSCMKAFDSLYFCYSPFHQGRQYYITGEFDNCRGRLKRFRMCVMSRFRSHSESEKLYEEVEMKEKISHPPVWDFRPEFIAKTEEHERKLAENLQEENIQPEKGFEEWWK